MGFRTYLGVIPKKEYNKIKSIKSNEELYTYFKTDYLGLSDIVPVMYEFGKYTEFKPPKGTLLKFFKNKGLQDSYNEDYILFVAKKEFFEYIINYYKSKIQGYYKELINPFLEDQNIERGRIKRDLDFNNTNKEDIYRTLEHVRFLHCEWNLFDPINLDNGSSVTTSWAYELCIFELVRLYKTFDWKKNVLVYYGW